MAGAWREQEFNENSLNSLNRKWQSENTNPHER